MSEGMPTDDQVNGGGGGSSSPDIERKSNLPDFGQSVKLKYVMLGYHYLIPHFTDLLLVPLLFMFSANLSTLTTQGLHQLWARLQYNLVEVIFCSSLLVFLATPNLMTRPRSVYLVDFACYKPEDARKCPRELFYDRSSQAGFFTEENLAFQKKILDRSGLGQDTYFPEAVLRVPLNPCMV